MGVTETDIGLNREQKVMFFSGQVKCDPKKVSKGKIVIFEH